MVSDLGIENLDIDNLATDHQSTQVILDGFHLGKLRHFGSAQVCFVANYYSFHIYLAMANRSDI